MLHQNDLIFCKTESGITSCGYNIGNMLLKNTLHVSNSQYSNSGTGKDDIRIAKLMEDLVVPSGLYYCHPMTKHKVFNYKPVESPREKGDKQTKDEINVVNGMLDESVYDKLLSLVSVDKRKYFDKKTRKNKSNLFQKIKDTSTSTSTSTSSYIDSNTPQDISLGVDTPSSQAEKGEKGEKLNKKKSMKIKLNTEKLLENQKEKPKQKSNQRKTKKVRFAD
jgi:hypothetical protein